jgi:hypothetical protein
MGLGALYLGLPIFGCATLALWWITRRLPAGWKGVGVGFGALLVIPSLAFGSWWGALSLLTDATYVCLDCGRTERQERFLFVPCSSSVLDDGLDYVQRFQSGTERGHTHRWHLDGCIRSAGRVACTEQYAQGWFRVLPKLQDRAAADELFREAQALPENQRLGLMQEVSDRVWIRSAMDGNLDQAFELWRVKHVPRSKR